MSGGSGQELQKKAWKKKPSPNDRGRDRTTSTAAKMCLGEGVLKRTHPQHHNQSCLWPGAQIWIRHKWRKLVTASLLLHCINWYSYPHYWNEFFVSCVPGFRLKFSRIAFCWKRLQLDSRSDLATKGSTLGFFDRKWLLSLTSYLWTEICKRCSINILFWRYQFFRCLCWGVCWSVP